jgi:tetratricopeptide (TPR) repeat protein
MNPDLSDRTVAILATHGFEQSELESPRDALAEAGADVRIISLPETDDRIRGWSDGDWGDEVEVFGTVAEHDAEDKAELRAWLRESVGLFLTHRGEHEAGARAAADALSLLADRPPSESAALAHNTLGITRAYLGDVDGARAAFEAAAATRRALGDAVGEAQAHGNVALLLEQAGRADEAVPALRDAIHAYRTVGHASGLALALARLALIERRRGEAAKDGDPLEAALALAREARDVAARIGYASALEQAESEIAETLLRLGRADEGLTHARRALEQASALEAGARERLARLRLGRLELVAGRTGAAREHLVHLEAAGEGGEEDRRGQLLLAAEIALAEGRTLDAGRLLGATEPDDGDPDLDAWWRRAHGHWRVSLQEASAAEAETAFADGRQRGPAGLRASGTERRTTAG